MKHLQPKNTLKHSDLNLCLDFNWTILADEYALI